MKNKLVYLAICAIAVGILIWFYTKGQLGQGLIYLMLLVCPLIHIVMMRGMHKMPGSKKDQTVKQSKNSDDREKHSCH